MIKYFFLNSLLLYLCLWASGQSENWGLIANSEFESEHIKSTLLFTGNWRNGVQFYDYNPSNNTGLYTIHPADSRHLGWSENSANRDYAVNTIIEAGLNIINMSCWGLPGSDNWAWWAPMQSSTQSHDELFNAALGKDILIAPFLESFAATDMYNGFSFMDDFPGTLANPAPELVILIEDLIDRYLIHPDNPGWPDKWARIYNRSGEERYMISIIHAASNKAGITDLEFAQGFDRVADQVYDDTGIRIGFTLDVLPPDSWAPGNFKATPSNTGPSLFQQSSLLAIQCFIPEIWQGESDEYVLEAWKFAFAEAWMETGIPWVHNVSSGYDAHIVFPESPVYGNNQLWRDLQDTLIQALEPEAFAVSAWNGYTEGFAGVPTAQYGYSFYEWLCDLLGGNCWYVPPEDLGQADIVNTGIQVVPNPCKDLIGIRMPDGNNIDPDLRIYSISGREMIVPRSQSGEHELDLSGLEPGVYIITITNKEIVFAEKILVCP